MMPVSQFLIFVVIGLVAGWLAILVLGTKKRVRTLLFGMTGSFAGTCVLLAVPFDLPIRHALIIQILIAALGAILVLYAARFIAR